MLSIQLCFTEQISFFTESTALRRGKGYSGIIKNNRYEDNWKRYNFNCFIKNMLVCSLEVIGIAQVKINRSLCFHFFSIKKRAAEATL